MELTPVQDWSQPTLAVRHLYGSSVASDAMASLGELEQLVDEEVARDSGGATCGGFEISQDLIEYEAELLRQRKLSTDLAQWVDRYDEVGDRTSYLWTWCRHGADVTTLASVSPAWHEEVCEAKFLGIMFDVLLDDIADQGGDADLLERLACLPLADSSEDWLRFTADQARYAEFSVAVWNELQSRVRRFPRYGEFADLLRYDYLQLSNTMRYAHLVNRFPSMLNLAEHDLYLPHNMHMMISATMDLMCSPDFDFQEIGRLREATWHAQYMGRIGNLITTWERELYEEDFTSAVFARAVIYGDLSLPELAHGDRKRVERAIREGRHEEYFLQHWREVRAHLLAMQSTIQTVDIGQMVHSLDRLICLHQASRGSK